MSSRWNRLALAAPIVLMGAALSLGGCVDNDISLSIDYFAAPDVSMAASGICEFDTASIAITRGVFDASLANKLQTGYDASFSVTNNLPLLTEQAVDMQAYYVSSFDVEIVPVGDGSAASQAFSSAASRKYSYDVATQRIAPGNSAFFSVQAIPAELAMAFAGSHAPTLGSIEIRVRPVATRAEEQQVGAYSSFPIDICNGCLTGAVALPECTTLKGQIPLVGNVCNYAQDEPVTCCTSGSNPVPICGTAVMNAAGM